MAYGAGFICGLLRAGIKADYFKEIYGTSAGGCIGSYYATGQAAEGERIFKNLLPKKLFRWTKSDILYLEQVFRKLEPLNVDALRKSTVKVYMSVTDVDTQTPHTICVNDAIDPVDVLLAGLSYRKPRKLNKSLYADGGFLGQVPLLFADRAKAEKIWIICGNPKGYRVSSAMSALALFFPHTTKMRRLYFRLPERQNHIMNEIEKRAELQIFRPESNLGVGTRGDNPSKVSEAFELGAYTAQKYILGHQEEFK